MTKFMMRIVCVFFFSISLLPFSCAQPFGVQPKPTRQDTLRGSIAAERAWWNVLAYHIVVEPDYLTKTIRGRNEIIFEVLQSGKNKRMQIDLQQPMTIDSLRLEQNMPLKKNQLNRDGNVYIIDFGNYEFGNNIPSSAKQSYSLQIYFSGKPREAVYPPWDGGWIWARDTKGRPFISVACQKLGASVWYPCKDHQSDEPDNGASLTIKVADTLVAVGNGRLKEKNKHADGTTSWTWVVTNPINNYNIIPYIGSYVHFSDTLMGEKGKLDLDYWVLDYNLEKARKQFSRDVKPTLRCFEYWFGPFPFYEDSYKLVEAPHLGMEHQSAIAYGNKYQNGYLGMDLSGSGWGKKWDYIIVHETGHEWFGNNITTNDIADMWVHEGFTDYSETLFVEWLYGKQAGNEYTQGLRSKILNDRPIIGPYGVNREGSSDMYYKGSNLIHMLRQIIDDDSLFRNILRGMNKTFRHKTVDSKDVEEYISRQAGKVFSRVFDQYLRTTKIPVLEYKIQGDRIFYRWANCVDGFKMPVRLETSGVWLFPETDWKDMTATAELIENFKADKNFYITVKKL
jgi:aminopeptidase N